MADSDDHGKHQRRTFSAASVHIFGLLVAPGAVITMVDATATTDMAVLSPLGLGWQSQVLCWALPSCAIACLMVFLIPLVIRPSRGLIGRLARIPVVFRYVIFAVVVVAVPMLIEQILFLPVQSIEIPKNVNFARQCVIAQEAGDHAVLRDGRILFLEEKQAAVQQALENVDSATGKR